MLIHLLMIVIDQNVTVPVKDTTYWCTVVQLPIEKRYIYKVASYKLHPCIPHFLHYSGTSE